MNTQHELIIALVKVIECDTVLNKSTKGDARDKLDGLIAGIDNPTEVFTKLEAIDALQAAVDGEHLLKAISNSGFSDGRFAHSMNRIEPFEMAEVLRKLLSTVNNQLKKHNTPIEGQTA